MKKKQKRESVGNLSVKHCHTPQKKTVGQTVSYDLCVWCGCCGCLTILSHAEVLLHASGPEEGDEGDDSEECCCELESVNNAWSVPLVDGDGDEVEDSREKEPEGVSDAKDEEEETLVILGLLMPCAVEGPGEVAPDAEPADKDVDDDKGECSACCINELC